MPAKKKTKKAPGDEIAAPAPDLREPLPQTAASWQQTLRELEAVVADLPRPAEPKPLELVEAMLHISFADGLPCGYGQEARRRIAANFVDRNEFRVTEAYEVEDLLGDLGIPDLFDRCLAVREAVGQIYADQNSVDLGFLREAGVGDRNAFFQRMPAMRPHVAAFLNNLLTVDELCFSDKSVLRVQQRLGMDPKDAVVETFTSRVRELLAPFGHLPLEVGKDLPGGKPNLSHPLSPASLLVRLLPSGKKR